MLTEAFGQVGPGNPGSSDPEHSVDEGAIVLGSASGVAFFSKQQVLDAFPVFVGDFVASQRGQVSFSPKMRSGEIGFKEPLMNVNTT